jgi:hypothetical protein
MPSFWKSISFAAPAVFALLAAGATAIAQVPPGHDPIKRPVTAANCKQEAGKPYFIEFRSRTAASYGHSFLFHGKLAGAGKFGKFEVAGLHPRGDDPAVYIQGHVVPVPAETGASYGDLDEQYLTARYCIVLSEAEYARAVVFIRNMQIRSTDWHAPTVNCNSFIGEIAEYLGLKAPVTPLLYPEAYVNLVRDLNGGKSALSSASTSTTP